MANPLQITLFEPMCTAGHFLKASDDLSIGRLRGLVPSSPIDPFRILSAGLLWLALTHCERKLRYLGAQGLWGNLIL